MKTNETATNATPSQPGSATGETMVLSVADTADLFGVTPQAIRKQIAAGKLNAHKHAGSWQIVLERATVETSATATAQPHAQQHRATSQPVAQPEADRYAAIVAPFLDRLEAQAQRIGYLEAELAAVTAERVALQTSQAAQEPPGATESPQGRESPVAPAQGLRGPRDAPWWRKWWPW